MNKETKEEQDYEQNMIMLAMVSLVKPTSSLA
jgi:hypothetical protein